jgi:flagellar basal-body rod protein FlgG
MLEGLYAAAAGMTAEQDQLDATANNISNEDTPGYRSEEVGFQDLLYEADDDDPSSAVVGAGSAASATGYSQLQGSLEQTGEPLDLAIEGDGYFEVRLSNGTTGLTRDGSFQLNARGQITTASGQRLVPPITVPAGTQASDINVASNGVVSVGGRRVGTLAIVTVPAPDKLLADGNSTYTATAASGAPRAARGALVGQGYLEQSNVDLDVEISNMESAQQGYEMASKAISMEANMGQIAATLK